jgi:LuxR family transcriptional regulator, maltose regulon positive regulatory protein
VLDELDARHPPATYWAWERALHETTRACLHLLAGDVAGAEAALAPVLGEPWLVVETTHARLRLARGEPQVAVKILDAAAAPREDMRSVTFLERCVLQSVSHHLAGDPARAASVFAAALELAERSGHCRPFFEAGPSIDALLRHQIRLGTAHRATVSKLLQRLADPSHAFRRVAPLSAPLTEREEVILRLLAAPLTNREIAAELLISINTLKTHLAHLYRKLDAANRREAVLRARDLGLLPAR